MKRFWLCLLLPVLLLRQPSPADAQVGSELGGGLGGGLGGDVSGEVESIGYENYFRPTAWTPMLIRLTSKSEQSADYQIRVLQEDLDRDRPIFIRQVTVTGARADGSLRDQHFRMYFKPTPLEGGLPDANVAGTNIAALQKKLAVELWSTGSSPKFVAELPITNTILNVDTLPSRGCKFVLAVTAGRSLPAHREYDGNTVGLLEDVAMVPVKTDALPENPIGYDGVDAILWLDADPGDLSSGGDDKLRALQNYVRGGGHLVICQQGDQWQRSLSFGDMLPVTIDGVRVKSDAEPLRTLATPVRSSRDQDQFPNPWDAIAGPMTLGVAHAKPDGIVDTWIQWPNDPASPYIARKNFGCGCVTWVAQDLGDIGITRVASSNWPVVWNRVFDWKDNPLNVQRVSKQAAETYADPSGLSAAKALIAETDLPGKGLGLITVAVFAFVVYWLVAGPGSYFYLLAKHRTGASWFVFAGTAIVFTCLTAVLVKLVLRGPLELKHFTVARTRTDDAVHVYSRLGLYVPRDGDQTMSLENAAAGSASSLTAFAISPHDIADSPSNDIGQPYAVPVPDPLGVDPGNVKVPFRSTMKKFEAEWTGPMGPDTLTGGIDGRVKLLDSPSVGGKLTNSTGRDLFDVYLAYKWKGREFQPDNRAGDYMLYMPKWPAGQTLDIKDELTYDPQDKDGVTRFVKTVGIEGIAPQHGRKCRGKIQTDWSRYWFSRSTGLTGEAEVDLDQSLIILSVFDRIAPDRRSDEKPGRFELLRFGAHRYDLSAALASGSAVVVAHGADGVDGPPLPINVDGRVVRGSGITLYQFIVPVDNGDTTPPTTAPSTN